MRRNLAILLLLSVCLAVPAWAVAPIHVLTIDGHIDPAMAGYLKDGVRGAENARAQAVLILMDTPGGLLTSTQEIIKTFFASRVPIIVYVSPNGATAASAGTFITMAADVAAMAPVTNIGSASPVSADPSGGSREISPTMKKKVTNFSVQYARSIAERRGRNAEWAEKAVSEAANLTASKALKMDVIDYVSESTADLMQTIDGKRVKLVSGGTITLRTRAAPLEQIPMGAWDTFLHYLSHPMVALFLMMGAMYGIIYELANPGSIFPGVIGAICIILLLYSFSVIPVNAAGFAFIVLAILLFAVDAFAPTHGVLTAGGVISLFFGLMMLFRSTEGFMISYWTLGAVTLVTGGFFMFVISMGVRALKKPYVSGREGVVGHVGEVRTDLEPAGMIFIDGSLWSATSEEGTISRGERVEVTRMDGLKLTVRRERPAE